MQSPTPSAGPRAISDADFPVASPLDDQLRFLLNYAVLAPSILNTQPWKFEVRDHKVYLYADRERQLRKLDADGRQLMLSCGAALFHLRVAARHYGFESAVAHFPDSDDPDLLATLSLTNPKRATSEDESLFRAISIRRTNRHPFAETPVPQEVVSAFERVAREEGARLIVLSTEEQKNAVAQLVEEGILMGGERPEIAAEIREWLRNDKDPRRDGVPDREQGNWDRRSDVRAPSSLLAPRKRELVSSSPAVLVLATDVDTPDAWLSAGEALGHVLLVAADRGLYASYVNQPVENDPLRVELSKLIGGGFPQLVFRIGYPSFREGTPRRSVQDVLKG
ncbi:MAG: nitroreductase family protein [Rubricoccaceae bacterium]|nr:nitroreductase family protein [Rubricoccaceae bacterium]